MYSRIYVSIMLVVFCIFASGLTLANAYYVKLKNDIHVPGELIMEKIKELENAALNLKEAMTKFRVDLEQNGQLALQHEEKTASRKPSYSVRQYGAWDPCVQSSGFKVMEEGVAQLNGRIYFLCYGLDFAPVYDAQTLKHIHNLTLPHSMVTSSRYLVANPTDKSLYLVQYSDEDISENNFNFQTGLSMWKASADELKWTAFETPDRFHIHFIGVGLDGLTILANNTNILSYSHNGRVRNSVVYTNPKSVRPSSCRRLIQTRQDSFLIPGYRDIYEVDSKGKSLKKYNLLSSSSGSDTENYISDISEGPNDSIIVANRNGVVFLNTISGEKFEANELSFQFKQAYRLSYDSINQRLIVIEYWHGGENRTKIFNVE